MAPEKYELKDVLSILDMTISGLATTARLSFDPVRRAVMGGKKAINYTTAEAIASAVGMGVNEIVFACELTDAGRPAHTGKPVTRQHADLQQELCPSCNIYKPLSNQHECA